jgi:hypothetical protein
MSDPQQGTAQRRRPARAAPEQVGAESSGLSAPAPTRTGPTLQEQVGQQAVRDALHGPGATAFYSMVASNLLLDQAGVNPGVFGEGNQAQQSNMRGGEAAGHSGWGGALQGMVGQVPEFANERIETATGGTMGPIAGVPGSVPGVPRHAIDAANSGSGSKGLTHGNDPRSQKPRNDKDVSQVFGALSQVPQMQFESMLKESGRSFLQGLGGEGVQELMGSMDMLPEAALTPEEGGQGAPGGMGLGGDAPPEEAAPQAPQAPRVQRVSDEAGGGAE